MLVRRNRTAAVTSSALERAGGRPGSTVSPPRRSWLEAEPEGEPPPARRRRPRRAAAPGGRARRPARRGASGPSRSPRRRVGTSASIRTRGASGDRGKRRCPSVRAHSPASTPMPRSRSASANSSAPGSCQSTEARSGSTYHARIRSTRRPASGSARRRSSPRPGPDRRPDRGQRRGQHPGRERRPAQQGVRGCTRTSPAPAATARPRTPRALRATSAPPPRIRTRRPFRQTWIMPRW